MTIEKVQTQNQLWRLRQVLQPHGPLPISPSQWWDGVSRGIYPQPVKLGPRITAWRKSDIEALIENGVPETSVPNPPPRRPLGENEKCPDVSKGGHRIAHPQSPETGEAQND